MTPEYIKTAASVFDSIERWKSFIELKALHEEIVKTWLRIGTRELRLQAKATLPHPWTFSPWGSDIDTLFHLNGPNYGPDSLAVGFGWDYEFHLCLGRSERFSGSKVDAMLGEPEFQPLRTPFDPSQPRQNLQSSWGSRAVEIRGFTFTNQTEPISRDELAWNAAHNTEEFVRQCLEKINYFTSVETTELMRQINDRARVVVGA